MITLKKNILLVEDSVVTKHLMRKILENQGYLVEEASNNIEAIEKIKNKMPHLIFLDIELEESNGLQLLKVLKQDKQLKNIKIIISSSHKSMLTQRKAYGLGADDFIEKPIQTNIILKILKKYMKEQEIIEKIFDFDANDLNSSCKIIVECEIADLEKGYKVLKSQMKFNQNKKIFIQKNLDQGKYDRLRVVKTSYLNIADNLYTTIVQEIKE